MRRYVSCQRTWPQFHQCFLRTSTRDVQEMRSEAPLERLSRGCTNTDSNHRNLPSSTTSPTQTHILPTRSSAPHPSVITPKYSFAPLVKGGHPSQGLLVQPGSASSRKSWSPGLFRPLFFSSLTTSVKELRKKRSAETPVHVHTESIFSEFEAKLIAIDHRTKRASILKTANRIGIQLKK